MAQPIGPANDQPDPAARRGPAQSKKKGCKKNKCSHWKGGKCRCGRE
ncbi:hypothetical protein [Cyanobium sp. NIES-981]|nr:hypothetical protein [Cyanobium sp. NIES-981]SBO41811.1 conserved protein of unknown function [Cyanobium sp. NIES-981]